MSAFDPDLVESAAGQIFHDIYESIDMVATGEIGGRIKVVEPNDIVATNELMQSTCFLFEFEEDVHVFLKVHSLDDEEIVKISSFGDLGYLHSEGAAPSVTIQEGVDSTSSGLPTQPAIGNTMLMTGNGNGFGADGAARGYVDLGVTGAFNWCFTPQADEKSEAMSIGVMVVPEPASVALLALGVIVALGSRRRGS